MLTAVNGYFNGTQIVMNENITLKKGQKLIITLDLDEPDAERKNTDLNQYRGLGGKMLDMDAQDYVRGLRENDRV